MKRFISIVTLLLFAACASSDNIFAPADGHIASPTAISVDVAANRLYLVNSNSKVLYDWHQGNFQAYDITNPLAPVLVKTAETMSFSGEVYLDTANSRAYLTNRLSVDDANLQDRLYVFNMDEASPDFLSFTEVPVGRNPFDIACCRPDGRAWFTSNLQELQYIDTGAQTTGTLSLLADIDTGNAFVHAEVSHIVLSEGMAFLSRDFGGIMVVNLDEVGVAGAEPVDYFIANVQVPRGLAIDGRTLYIVAEGTEGDTWRRYLLVLDVSSLTPRTDNTNVHQLNKEDNGMLIAAVDLGNYPQEVVLSQNYAFVTVMTDNVVSVIDRATNTKVKDIAVGTEPFSMALYTTADNVDQYLYVGNLQSNNLSIIDIPSLTAVATYP